MIEDISSGFSTVYDALYDAAQSACSFTGRVCSAAYTGITNIGSMFFQSSQSSQALANRVEESKSGQITLNEALASYVNTLSLELYIPKGANFQIIGALNEVCTFEDEEIYFIEGKFDFDNRSLNAMFSMAVDRHSRVFKNFGIDYIIDGPLFSAQLFSDIVQGLVAFMPETRNFIEEDSLLYIKTEEFEGKREQVWTFSKNEKVLSVAITLYNDNGETNFVIHNPRNQMVQETKYTDSV